LTWTALDISNMKLLNISPPLWQYRFLTVLLLNNNRLQQISPEIANVRGRTSPPSRTMCSK
jgi:Leucine-rich repeat (LRR) protein